MAKRKRISAQFAEWWEAPPTGRSYPRFRDCVNDICPDPSWIEHWMRIAYRAGYEAAKTNTARNRRAK